MRFVLPFTVFVSGAAVMVLELVGARIVAPYLGTSIIVWTSLIGVFLAALSAGYFIGGRIADAYPPRAALALTLLGASASAALSAYTEPLLSFSQHIADLRAGATIAIILLFAPTALFLGMVTPLAVKLALVRVEQAGRTVGTLYALSSIGSILGTFLGGFILISYIGSHAIVIFLALTLLSLALLVSFSYRIWKHTPLVLLIALFITGALFVPHGVILDERHTLIADVDTQYGRSWVFDTRLSGMPVRILTNIAHGYQGMMYHGTTTPAAGYLALFDAFELFRPDTNNALTIGGSAYVYPRHFLAHDEGRTITVVEIDPGITALARTYFGLIDDERMRIIHEDGRAYLNRTNETYDAIFLDAFRDDLSIPFHLATHEAAEAMQRTLTKDGMLVINIVATPEGASADFLDALYHTYADVFPHRALYAVDGSRVPHEVQNFVLFLSNTPLEEPQQFASEFPRARRVDETTLAFLPPLTDDFAPVERYFLGW